VIITGENRCVIAVAAGKTRLALDALQTEAMPKPCEATIAD
jgi:hypothetical protein